MNLFNKVNIGPTGGETFTVTCFTCGMPSSKEWAQRVRSRPLPLHHPQEPFFPFLLDANPPPPGASVMEDGSTYLCAFCHALLEFQWNNYEMKGRNALPVHERSFNVTKFICAVCGVETYRKRVRALPFQEFPFLIKQRQPNSITLGNNPLAVVCLDCSETLWAQSAEYDRWGLPVHKRHFNWMARPPPPEDSVEATVARLPSGETQLPRCPPTDPLVPPRTNEPTALPESIPPIKPHRSKISSSHSHSHLVHTSTSPTSGHSSSRHHHHEINVPQRQGRKSSSTGANQSPSHLFDSHNQPPIVTVAPMSTQNTMTNMRKESFSYPSQQSSHSGSGSGGIGNKYEANTGTMSLGQSLFHHHQHHPSSSSSLFPTASSYRPPGPFSWPSSLSREAGDGQSSELPNPFYSSGSGSSESHHPPLPSWPWPALSPDSPELLRYHQAYLSSLHGRSLGEAYYPQLYPPTSSAGQYMSPSLHHSHLQAQQHSPRVASTSPPSITSRYSPPPVYPQRRSPPRQETSNELQRSPHSPSFHLRRGIFASSIHPNQARRGSRTPKHTNDDSSDGTSSIRTEEPQAPKGKSPDRVSKSFKSHSSSSTNLQSHSQSQRSRRTTSPTGSSGSSTTSKKDSTEGREQEVEGGGGGAVEEKRKHSHSIILPKKRHWQPPPSTTGINISEESQKSRERDREHQQSSQGFERKRKFAVASLDSPNLLLDFKTSSAQKKKFSSPISATFSSETGGASAIDLSLSSSTLTISNTSASGSSSLRARTSSCPSTTSLTTSSNFSIAYLCKSETFVEGQGDECAASLEISASSNLLNISSPNIKKKQENDENENEEGKGKEKEEKKQIEIKEEKEEKDEKVQQNAEEPLEEEILFPSMEKEEKIESIPVQVEASDSEMKEETKDKPEKSMIKNEEIVTQVNFVTIGELHINPKNFIQFTIDEYIAKEKESEIKRKNERNHQIGFLSQLGLITPEKKRKLDLEQVINRSMNGTLPLLKLRPKTPPRENKLEKKFDMILKQALPTLSLNSLSDPEKNRFLNILGLKPLNSQSNNHFKQPEQATRSNQNGYVNSSKETHSEPSSTKMIPPAVKEEEYLDNSSDFKENSQSSSDTTNLEEERNTTSSLSGTNERLVTISSGICINYPTYVPSYATSTQRQEQKNEENMAALEENNPNNYEPFQQESKGPVEILNVPIRASQGIGCSGSILSEAILKIPVIQSSKRRKSSTSTLKTEKTSTSDSEVELSPWEDREMEEDIKPQLDKPNGSPWLDVKVILKASTTQWEKTKTFMEEALSQTDYVKSKENKKILEADAVQLRAIRKHLKVQQADMKETEKLFKGKEKEIMKKLRNLSSKDKNHQPKPKKSPKNKSDNHNQD